ncbi:flagellar hook-associated protein FlgL [Caldinitratiruptor microaerophilus]|uniref:Flagellar hook-associated protein FlgL n=1 Tax=Caldinitratiruptor microaerophilus TaxID=671077 RepID=A0AA35G9R0_9FIRM|nr:flagellar hook-associated protein FlgL [Caldinitratiruptor microaerophilus]BDG61743.1 flagellar hook-associated protein FlgL [Caldinitratiruptor microaerophilus]
MRITNRMMAGGLLDDLDRVRERMYRLETDISTGVWLHRPSDGPPEATSVMHYQEILARIRRYQTNMGDARAWMTTSEKAVSDLIEIVHRARELTIQGASDTSSVQSRESIRQEILQLRDYAIQVGNATYNGQYVFSGFATDVPPFQVDGSGNVVYKGDTQAIERDIGFGQRMRVNILGSRIGGDPADPNDVFVVLGAIANSLSTGSSADLEPAIGQLENILDRLLGVQAELGARQRTLELNEARMKDLEITVEGQLEGTRGTDMEATIINFNQIQRAYQVALAMGARILPPTLIDFLQ